MLSCLRLAFFSSSRTVVTSRCVVYVVWCVVVVCVCPSLFMQLFCYYLVLTMLHSPNSPLSYPIDSSHRYVLYFLSLTQFYTYPVPYVATLGISVLRLLTLAAPHISSASYLLHLKYVTSRDAVLSLFFANLYSLSILF